MGYDTSITRCEADHPNRCQAKNARGDQCMNLAMKVDDKFAKYCSIHGGVAEAKKNENTNSNMYRLAKYSQRVGELANHGQVKGLRDEIGILRMVLEERLNKCEDTQDLMLQSHIISNLVGQIEKVVTSCHRLEASMGQLLDKQQIIQFAEAVIAIISEEVTDAETLSNIANKIAAATEQQLDGTAKSHAVKKVSEPLAVGLDD